MLSTIFTELEVNNCFSIIARVIIRATVFSILLSIVLCVGNKN